LKDRSEGKPKPHIDTNGIELPARAEKKYFKRFQAGWRLAHLAFAVVIMALVVTGGILAYAYTDWAPALARAMGGQPAAGQIHRILGYSYMGIFVIATLWMMWDLLRTKGFKLFGPDSLLPNWKDASDMAAMFKWFVGKGPRPMLDRWTYFMKFDFWALFWGTGIIGLTGLAMAFPHVTGKYLPGWVFNVAMLLHSYEALLLCAVFIFTVHFFTNHFRPDKWPPPNIVMFTGTMSLEEFREDHPAHYKRLLESGELEKHLVDPPSGAFRLGSVVLGIVLLAIGIIQFLVIAVGLFTG
jgi:cytochrome b subunit of formate dehydrogenase